MKRETEAWSDLTPHGRPAAGPVRRTRLLVLGFGNELRSDDGIGPHLADQVAGWRQPGVRALAVPLLTPELAALVAAVDLVVFVDAAAGPADRPRLIPLEPSASTTLLGHASTPESLLALAGSVFGRSSPGWILSVPAKNFELGQSFSDVTRRGATRALCLLRHLSRGSARSPRSCKNLSAK
jgi:hydrogenase maturation protease